VPFNDNNGQGANGFDPSSTAKLTQGFFATPGVEMEGYSTRTLHEGRSPVESVINAKTLKPESTTIKTPLGNYSLGVDGSFTYGNSFVSFGTTANGRYILDLSIPTGSSSSIGTTLYYNPQVFLNNVNYILSPIGDALSRSRTLYPIPMLPALMLGF
jgi:hypothetical protein